MPIRQFQINHLFNGSFATLCRQAGRKKLKFKLVNYSVYYQAKTVLQYCARKTYIQEILLNLILHFCTEMSLFLIARFLQVLLFSCKAILHLQDPCKILFKTVLSGYVASYLYFPTTDKIQALKRFLFPDPSQREHSNFVQVKGHKYFHFPKIRAGKSVKQANKFELPNWETQYIAPCLWGYDVKKTCILVPVKLYCRKYSLHKHKDHF